MTAIDSTVLIDVLRDRTGRCRNRLEARVVDAELAFTPFTHFEVLKGCKDMRQWDRIARYLADHRVLAVSDRTWEGAARIAFDARRKGLTIRSSVDCLIAQVVIEHDRLLLHKDHDFETIAKISALKQEWLDVSG